VTAREARVIQALLNTRVDAALHTKCGDMDKIAAFRDREASITVELHSERGDWTNADVVGRCRLKLVGTSVESTWFQRLKLEYDKPLSSFAFNFNVRLYNVAAAREAASAGPACALELVAVWERPEVGRYRLNLSNPSWKRVCFQSTRVKLKCDYPLSNFAFNFNLRRYTEAILEVGDDEIEAERVLTEAEVGRCSLTVSTPELKACLFSALASKMWWTAFKLCFQFQRAPLQRGGCGGGGGGGGVAQGRAVQVDSIKTRVESAYGFSAWN
jgi:hypothetical protein